MESKIVLILFVGLCGVYAQSSEETENFEYPCDSTDDWGCIRDFLASTGQCDKASHEDGVPLKMEDIHTYVPKLNVSLISKDCEVTFHGSKILDFYMNKDSNNLILTVDFDAITLVTPRTIFNFERFGKDPLVIEEYINITYSAAITIRIAWSDHIDVDDLRASGYVKDGSPSFIIGPKVTESSNEIVQNALAGLEADIPTVMQELWLTKAYYYTCVFLNKFLCDFGYLYDGRINRP